MASYNLFVVDLKGSRETVEMSVEKEKVAAVVTLT